MKKYKSTIELPALKIGTEGVLRLDFCVFFGKKDHVVALFVLYWNTQEVLRGSTGMVRSE